MKELILKKSEWICGAPRFSTNEPNCLGVGSTFLLNEKGFMCCLGQFSLQLNSALKKENILRKGSPSALNTSIPDLVDESGFNTKLADAAIYINDDTKTSIEEKIKLLTELFAKHDYKIIVQE